eukprot:TRINITY_DN2742_c0_g1_i1.p1 TRINITY_DN2742_c0_g1~~TRINITY_DN2742_c0_g1_i1.p1  ORF type:complete len:216 (+),score=10.23 TRINITY_DN2742_c0_g1_i1:65-712(+)
MGYLRASESCCFRACPLKEGVFIIGLLLTIFSCVSLLVVICELAGAFVFFGNVSSAGVLYVLISNVPRLLCGVLCIMATSNNIQKDVPKQLWLLGAAFTSYLVQFTVSIVSFLIMMILSIVQVENVVQSVANEFVSSTPQEEQSLTTSLAKIVLIVDLVLGILIATVIQLYLLWIIWSYKEFVKTQNQTDYAPLVSQEQRPTSAAIVVEEVVAVK